MTVLFSDKTGTITQNRLRVTAIDPLPTVNERDVVIAAALASKIENNDPLDMAILADAELRHIVPLPVDLQVTKFVPFSAATRCTNTFCCERRHLH